MDHYLHYLLIYLFRAAGIKHILGVPSPGSYLIEFV